MSVDLYHEAKNRLLPQFDFLRRATGASSVSVNQEDCKVFILFQFPQSEFTYSEALTSMRGVYICRWVRELAQRVIDSRLKAAG